MNTINKTIVSIGFLLLAGLIMTGVLIYRSTYDVVNKNMYQSITMLNHSMSTTFENLFSDLFININFMAVNSEVVKSVSKNDLTESEYDYLYSYISDVKSFLYYAENIYILNKNGELVVGTYEKNYGKRRVNRSFFTREFFDASKVDEELFTGPFFSRLTGKKTFIVQRPILKKGVHIGSVAMAIDETNIAKFLVNPNSELSNMIFIVQSDGDIVLAPSNEFSGRIDFPLNEQMGVGRFSIDLTTDHYEVFYQRIMNSDLYILNLIPESFIVNQSNGVMKQVIIFKAVFTILFMTVFIFAMRRLKQILEKTQNNLENESTLLKTIIDAIPDYIFYKDENSRYLGANKMFKDQVLLENGEEIKGCTDEKLFALSDGFVKVFLEKDKQTIDDGKTIILEELVKFPRGNIYGCLLETIKTPYHVEKTGQKGLVGISRDITSRKKAEKEVERARNEAIEANKAKSQFLARMSHEIRTPLNGIIGMNRIALQANASSEIAQYLCIIGSSANSLLDIVNDLLDFSKIEAGKMALEKRSFMLSCVISNIDSMLKLKAEKSETVLKYDIDPNIPDIVIGDSLRFSQVLINLMSNAVKFTEHGSVTLKAVLSQKTDSAVEIYFTVTDTGIGINNEHLTRLFMAFSQANESISRKYGGTGLGLSICKSLIELMDGRIWIDSRQGVGTCVHVLLSLGYDENVSFDDIQRERHENESQADSLTSVQRQGLKGKRVLVVDDNEINIQIIVHILSPFELEIDQVYDGDQAVEAVKNKDYDMVFMDIQMPSMSGHEATRHIRAMPDEIKRSVPVVAITANAMTGDILASLDAGMNDHIPKPFYVHDFIRILLKHLIKDA